MHNGNDRSPSKETPIVQLINFFLPLGVQLDDDEKLKYRVYISVCLLLSSLLTAANLVNAFAYNLPLENLLISLSFTVPLIIVFVGLPLLIRQFNQFNLCVHIGLLFITAAVALGVAITGGPLTSTAALLLVVPPMFGFCLGGFRIGIIWMLINFLLLAIGSMLELGGLEYPMATPTDSFKANQLVNMGLGFIATMIIMIIYEYNNNRLRQSLTDDRNKFRHAASHDALTGAGNRNMFYEHLERTWRRATRHSNMFAIIAIDLDGFKAINDQYGHAVGDAVLISVTERLHKAVRGSDILCRLGGDEFSIILEQLSEPPEVVAAADRVRKVFEEAFLDIPGSYQLGASIGSAIYPNDSTDLQTLEKLADQRMYAEKTEKAKAAA